MRNYAKSIAFIKAFNNSCVFKYLFSFALLLSVFHIDTSAQIVNKRLYLKSNSTLSRVQPTSPTFTSSVGLSKGTATIVGTPITAVSGVNGSTGPYTTSYTVGAGAERMLIVGISSGNETPVTSVTFGSQSLIRLAQQASTDVKVELWYLLAPNVGTANVTVNFSNTVALRYAIGVVSFINVDQGAPFGNIFAQNFTTATSVNYSLASNLGDQVIDVVGVLATGGSQASFLPGTNQTEVYRATNSKFRGGSSTRLSQAGTTSMSWSNPATGPWSVLAVNLKGTANEITFNQSPTLCSSLILKAGQPITIRTSATVIAGSCGSSSLPYVAYLMRGTDTLVKEILAVNSGLSGVGTEGTLTWTGTLATDYTLPPGGFLTLELSNDCINSTVRIDYDGTSKVSYIELPTSTYINVNSVVAYNAPYPGGSVITEQIIGSPVYLRTVVSDPFGFNDITGLNVNITGASVTTGAGISVATSGCTRTYEYVWNPSVEGSHNLSVTALEGTEGTVTHTNSINLSIVKPNLSVTKTVTSAPIAPIKIGDTITYTIKIKNTGSTNLTLIPVADQFSSSCFQYVSTSRTPNSVSQGIITWNNVGPLSKGDSISWTVRLKTINNCNPATNTVRVQNAKDTYNYLVDNKTSSVNITVEVPPVAVDNVYCIQGTTALNVLSNDTDADLTGFLSTNTSLYTVAIETFPVKGSVSINPDKTIQFNPVGMVENERVSFRYRVTENAYSSFFDTATVTVLYSAVNNAPTAVNDSVTSTSELPVLIDVLANDSDPDGSISLTAITVQPSFGSVVIQSDGKILYTPYAGFSGEDVFSYQICDNGCPTPSQCTTAQVKVKVVFAYYVCKNGTSNVSVAAIPGATGYNWNLPPGAVILSGAGTNQLTINWSNVAEGSYNICSVPQNNCGPGSEQCVLVVINNVQATAVPLDISCFGQSSGFIDVTVNGGIAPYSYAWVKNGSSSNINIQDPSGLSPGTYQVVVTDKYGCKATSNQVAITQPGSALSLSGSITNESLSGASNGAVSITVSGGTAPYSYLWSKYGDPIYASTSQNITGLSAGTYIVNITDAKGCVITKYYTVNTTGGAFSLSYIQSVNVLCFGQNTGSILLEVIGGSGNYTYQWYNRADSLVLISTTKNLTGVVAGNYKVIINDGVNPAMTAYAQITQPSIGITAGASPTNVSCYGSANGSINLLVNGGSAPYSYLWSTGQITKDINQLLPGSYSVNIQDANGCTASTSANITQPTQLVINGNAINTACLPGNQGTINLSVTGGTAPYSYKWSDGPVTANRTGLQAGNYSVTVTDAVGCVVGKNFTVLSACLSIEKYVLSGPVNNTDGTFSLTYQIKVQNTGNSELFNVKVEDNLKLAFPSPATYSIQSISSIKFNINNGFNGDSNKQLILSGQTLSPAEQGLINISLIVTPVSLSNPYINTAFGSAKDKDSVAVNGQDTAVVSLVESPLLGLAKYVSMGPLNNGDGSFEVEFTFSARNYGDVRLDQISLSDNLVKTFGAGNFSVTSISSTSFNVNTGYNGSSDTMLLSGANSLAINETKSLKIGLVVTPSAPETYFNQAFGKAVGPSGTFNSDLSQNGTSADPDNNGNPKDNNQPTPVIFPENPEIALSKRLTDSPINNNDGTYTLTYEFKVKNSGDVNLYNIQINDNLQLTFPSKNVVVNNISSSTLIPNFPGYTGLGNNNLLTGSNTLLIGEIKSLLLTITVTPETFLGPYLNSAIASGVSPFNTVVNDISNDGTDADPENDGPGDNQEPTSVLFTESPILGLSKTIGQVVNNNDGSYDVTYSIQLVNMGNVPLNHLQVTDNIASTFIGVQSFSVLGINASAGLMVNDAYNGISDIDMLIPSSSGVSFASTEVINVFIRVVPGTKMGVYFNSAIGTGTSVGGNLVSDVSQNGNNPDPDDDDDPTNNNQPTPLSFTESPQIKIEKDLIEVTLASPDSYNITFDCSIANTGNVPLKNIRLVDDLSQAFALASGFNVVSTAIIQQPTQSTVHLNPSYNGDTDIDLLAGNDTLKVGETAKVRLIVTLTFSPGDPGGPYINEAAVLALSPGGRNVIDIDTAAVSFFESVDIKIEKTFESIVRNSDGTQKVTFKLQIKNLSNVALQNLIIYDDILSQFGDLNPTDFLVEEGQSLLPSPNWNGSDTSNILFGRQAFDLQNTDDYYVYISFNVTPILVKSRLNTSFTQGAGPLGSIATATDTATVYFLPAEIVDYDVNSVCINNAPYLNYSLITNFNPTGLPMTMKWYRSGMLVPGMMAGLTPIDSVTGIDTIIGSSLIYNGNGTWTLSGQELWPGAVVLNNSITDWPGWIFENGIWKFKEDGFGQYRNGPTVSFSFNPQVSIDSIVYPPSFPSCNPNPPATLISGNVFDDFNGLYGSPFNTVDGTGVGVIDGKQLYINIIRNDTLLVSVPVANDGSFSQGGIPYGNYELRLTTKSGNYNTPALANSIPVQWTNTGENLGQGSGNDLIVDGVLSLTLISDTVRYANFGIVRIPVAHDKSFIGLDPNTLSFLPSNNVDYPNKMVLNNVSGSVDTSAYFNDGRMPGKVSGNDPYNGLISGASGTETINTFYTDGIVYDPNNSSVQLTNTVLVYNFEGQDFILIPNPSPSDPSYVFWDRNSNDYQIPDFNANELYIWFKTETQTGFLFYYGWVNEAKIKSSPSFYLVNATGPLAILPVELLYFTANNVECKVQLNWATASEKNNDYFTISRSTNLIEWETISQINGQGTVSLPQQYSFFDREPIKGLSYYRLTQTDYDGTIETFPLVSMDMSSCATIYTKVYPIPTKDLLNIEVSHPNLTKGWISIYNSTGALLQQIKFTESLNVMDVSQLPSGSYFINILLEGNEYIQRFLIAR